MTDTRDYAAGALEDIAASASHGTWGAHAGCAVLACVLLIEEDLVEQDARDSVRRVLDSSGIRPNGRAGHGAKIGFDEFKDRLISQLKVDAHEVKEIGHDVIYSSYVLKALDFLSLSPRESLLAGMLASRTGA